MRPRRLRPVAAVRAELGAASLARCHRCSVTVVNDAFGPAGTRTGATANYVALDGLVRLVLAMATWQLQTAKAKLSELLRAVREEGPQVISVRGKEEFVVMRNEAGATRARTWDDLYASVEGAGERLLLPPRVVESLRDIQLAEDFADWSDEEE